MSKEDIVRYHRLKNFGNTFHHTTKVSKSTSNIGPQLGKDFDGKRNKGQKNERIHIRKSKHFNISDIIRLRKIDFD